LLSALGTAARAQYLTAGLNRLIFMALIGEIR
jgi:hypothetical protein